MIVLEISLSVLLNLIQFPKTDPRQSRSCVSSVTANQAVNCINRYCTLLGPWEQLLLHERTP